MIEALFPSSRPRCVRRIGLVLMMLAVLVAVFFPASATAGTANALDRWATAAALLAVGLILRFSRRGMPVHVTSLVILALAGALVPAWWVATVALSGLLYLALTFFPRAVGDTALDSAESTEMPGVEIVRENIEAVAMALVLALTVREFAVEAFVIPTGSMQPTILGEVLYPEDQKRPGDRLVASKLPVLLHELPRFSIVVFHWPLFRETNYIKRLIGLPGEDLEIRDGDIYVNGKIVSKPDAVQETLWFRQYPDPDDARDAPLEAEFHSAGPGDVTFAGATARLSATAGGSDGGAEALIRFAPQYDRRNDRRVTATIESDGLGEHGTVVLRVDSPGRRVELEVSSSAVRLTAPGIENRELDVRPMGTAARHRYGLAAVDGEVRVYLDGRQQVRMPYGDQGSPGIGERSVTIGARSCDVTISEVVVDEDIHYERPGDGIYHWQIPEGCYVMLGDNTRSSNDSRLWKANVVTTRDGARYVAADKVREDDGPERANFRNQDGHYVFIDSDGVPRSIPVDDATVSRESTPYVEERDLIGRAFFIFFPFPPFGDFRPRLLP